MPDRSFDISRRRLLKFSGASALASISGRSLATTGPDPRFLMIILRGGADGLSMLPPTGDPDLADIRGRLSAFPTLPLDGFFSLHGAMPTMGELWKQQQLIGFHAISTPYKDRSHFDAQNVLESGLARPDGSADGWLNRALALRPDSARRGLSVGAGTPLIMRGAAHVGSWALSQLPVADPTLVDRLVPLWANDPLLARMLPLGRELQAMTGGMGGDASSGRMAGLLEQVGQLMARADGPRIVAMDSDGWDMHGTLLFHMNRLSADLDQGIARLRAKLGDAWSQTVVLIASEFGRTVEPNGTGGSDHGIGGSALLLGGAVRGGRMIADWPGLRPADRVAARDLRPTRDLRDVFAAALADHLSYSPTEISETILPGFAAANRTPEMFHRTL